MNWKTFETLPKESQLVLITDGLDISLARINYSCLGDYWFSSEGICGTEHMLLIDEADATHWCEVPELPKKK